MKKILLIAATISLFFSLFLINGTAMGDSLWDDSSSSLYTDKPKASFKVGDLITIIIVESAKASQNAESSNDKNASVSTSASGKLSKLITTLSGKWDADYKGKGSTTRGGALTAKLTTTVKEINSDGMLIIEGKQNIKINSEKQILTVTGKVRPDDISVDNTVYSTYIADASIEYQGKGTIGETQGPGILTRIFHWIF